MPHLHWLNPRCLIARLQVLFAQAFQSFQGCCVAANPVSSCARLLLGASLPGIASGRFSFRVRHGSSICLTEPLNATQLIGAPL
jgi:hypothetical protein